MDDDSPVELIWPNAHPPKGVITREEPLLENEVRRLGDLLVTTPERTAFDLGRRRRLDDSIARLDALARATHLKVGDVDALAKRQSYPRPQATRGSFTLVDAGAESPRETWLRLLLIRDRYPRPETQIPVTSPDGRRRYYVDMGWRDLLLAVEYEGDHHRTTRELFAYGIERAEDIREVGWLVLRVAARNHPAELLRRIERVWRSRTS